MLALLFLATLSVVLLPMLPALVEWQRPSDVQPLPIDEADALDPPYLARSFAARLAQAVDAGAAVLGRTEIVACSGGDAALALDAQERAARASHRLWHAAGDLRLPDGVAFYAEVWAAGALRAAERGVHKALWAGGALHLGARASVLRWAHGDEVFVAEGCELAGRVTAERNLVVAPGTSFMLLHAPHLQFLPRVARVARPAGTSVAGTGAALPGVRWDASGRRAVCSGPLQMAAATAWRGDLVCHGDLALGAGCRVAGSLKVRGRFSAGPGCVVQGHVFAEGPVQLGPGCSVRGVLMSESGIALGPGCAVGTPAAPVTVAAPRIDIGAGVQVYGTVWAQQQGRCVAAAQSAAADVAELADAPAGGGLAP